MKKSKKIERIVRVDRPLFESWKIKQEHGDIGLIVEFSKKEKNKKHRNTIYTALKLGYMTESTFNVVKKYFENKQEVVLK